MKERVVDYDKFEITDNSIKDILWGTKVFAKKDISKHLGIYGFEEKKYSFDEIVESFEFLKQFGYIKGYGLIENSKNTTLFSHEIYLTEEIYNYHNKVPTFTKRLPKIIFDVDVNRWNYLYFFSIRKNGLRINSSSKEKLKKLMSELKNNHDQFKVFLTHVKENNIFLNYNIEEISEISLDDYVEDVVYYLYYTHKDLLFSKLMSKINEKDLEYTVYLTNDLTYIKNTGLIKNLSINEFYMCKPQEKIFLNILSENISPIEGKIIEQQVYEEQKIIKGSSAKDIYNNLLKSLRKKEMIGEKEQFVKLSKGSFILTKKLV